MVCRNVFFIIIALFIATSLTFGSASILIKVMDDKNEPLAGATIILSNKDKLIPDTPLMTNDRGEVFYAVLPIGQNYEFVVQFPGFAMQKIQEIRLTGGNQPTVYVIKMFPEIREKIEVRGIKEVVRTEETQNSTTFSDSFINDLPLAGREYQSIISRSAAVLDEDQDGNPIVKGSRERDFKALVDGVSNVDPLTGTFLSDVNPDAIEEIEVITGGAGAEFSRAQGGFAKITTKQGSNEFAGVFNFYYRSRTLDGNGATEFSKDRFSDYKWINPSVSLSGALVKDKLFWTISHEYFDVGYPINTLFQPLVIQTKRTRNFDKLTWQVTGKNKLIFQVSSDPSTIENLGIGTLTSPESGYKLESGGPTYTITWQAPVSPKLLVTSLVAYSDTKMNILPMSYNVKNHCLYHPMNELIFPGSTTAYCYNETTMETRGTFWYTWRDERQRLTVKSDAEYFIEKFMGASHRVKSGFVLESERYYRDVEQRPYITYYVETESGFTSPDPGQQPGTNIYGYVDTFSFYPSRSLGKASGNSFGFYIEDSLKPLKTLTINLGFRLDREVIDSPGFHDIDVIEEKDNFEDTLRQIGYDNLGPGYTDAEYKEWASENLLYQAFGAFTGYENEYEICENVGDCLRATIVNYWWQKARKASDFQITNMNIAPRIGFSWDPWNRGKAKIFGTYGRYYDKLFLAVPLWEQAPVSYQAFYGIWSRGISFQDAREQAIIYGPAHASGVSIRMIDKDLKTPHSDEITFGFETEIATETSLKVMVTKREYKDQLQDIDINHYAGDYGPAEKCDPRVGAMELGYEPDGTLDDCTGSYRWVGWSGPPFYQPIYYFYGDGIPDLFVANPLFNEIFLIGNFNKAVYKDFVVELLKRRHNHWELQASYVYSVSKGDAEDYAQGLGDDPTTLEDEKGYLSTDQRHVLKLNTTMEVPLWDMRVGALVTWESGLPYSLISKGYSLDANNPYLRGDWQSKIRYRTNYVSNQRNNMRNESYWSFDVHVQKDLMVNKVMLSLFADIFNLLNNDRLRIYNVQNDVPVGERRFGRQFQVGFKVKF